MVDFKRKTNPKDILPCAASGVTLKTSMWERKPAGDRRHSSGCSAVVLNGTGRDRRGVSGTWDQDTEAAISASVHLVQLAFFVSKTLR